MTRPKTGHLAAAILISVLGCSSRMPGGERAIPARPSLGARIERVGRPLTGNALIGLFAPDAESDARKEAYNRAGPGDWPSFAADIQHSLALYDGFDGACGNQWLAGRGPGPARYQRLAALLADDRLWINSAATTCTQYLAVERAALAGVPSGDCGGRTPGDDAIDVFRSLLALGAVAGLDDGVAGDDHAPSTRVFPFLAAP